MSEYRVQPVNHPLNSTVQVPGSKSITNRALLMAALSDDVCELHGVLFSDDSRHFLSSLVELGFIIEVNEIEEYVIVHGCGGKIPRRSGRIHVGSAGTAARFLTAMLALSPGTDYEIAASAQMKKRPMQPLFGALTAMGAHFTYLEREGHLPVRVQGAADPAAEVALDISRSTQFLSALLMTAPMLEQGLTIHITGEKTEGAYIRITTRMMHQFGCDVQHTAGTADYTIQAGSGYAAGTYQIEPDVSAACYFYAAAALLGGRVIVRNVHKTSMQGDLKFLQVLQKMGCVVEDGPIGICVTGPAFGSLTGVDVDMNDFSDQTMTLAAIAPFASSPTHIRNIGHIRMQESDRIHAIVTELQRLEVPVEEENDGIFIRPGTIHPATVQTYQDHRMAMAFALIGLKTEGIIIADYECCGKTFENYFQVLEELH